MGQRLTSPPDHWYEAKSHTWTGPAGALSSVEPRPHLGIQPAADAPNPPAPARAEAGPPEGQRRTSKKDFDHKAGTCGCFFLLVVGTIVGLAVGGWYVYSQLELRWARQIAESRLQDDFGNRWKITSEEIAPRVDEAAFKGTVESEDRMHSVEFRMILTKKNGKWRVLSLTTKP